MTTFRSISHMIVGAVASLGILTSAQAQDFAFEASGQFTPTCSTGFSGRPAAEGMSFHFETTLSLDLLLGEPVVRSSLAWRPVGFGATCIQPYGQDELVRLGSVDQYDSEGLAHPIDVDLVAELIVPSAPNGRVFLPFNPGALSKTAGEPGYNTAGSPNWDGLFFTLPGLGSNFWDTDNYAFLSAEAAKDIFSAGFDVAQVHVAQADFDLTELKSNYGAQVDTASALVKVANRLEQWGRETFDSYPDGVAARITANTQLDAPEQVVALRNTIDDIQDLHDQLQEQSGDADSKAAIGQQKAELAPFLDEIDTTNKDETFRKLLLNASTSAVQKDRDDIEAQTDSQRLEAQEVDARLAALQEEDGASQIPENPDLDGKFEFVNYLTPHQQQPFTIPEFMCNSDMSSLEISRRVIEEHNGKIPGWTRDLGSAGSPTIRKIKHYDDDYQVTFDLYRVNGQFVCVSIEMRVGLGGWKEEMKQEARFEFFDATGQKISERVIDRPSPLNGPHKWGYGHLETMVSENLNDPHIYFLFRVMGRKSFSEYDISGATLNAIPGILTVGKEYKVEMSPPVLADTPREAKHFITYVQMLGTPHLIVYPPGQGTALTYDFRMQLADTRRALHEKGSDHLGYRYATKNTFSLVDDGEFFVAFDGVLLTDQARRDPGKRIPDIGWPWYIYPSLDGKVLLKSFKSGFYRWGGGDLKVDWYPMEPFDGWVRGYLYRATEDEITFYNGMGVELGRIDGKLIDRADHTLYVVR